MQESNVSSIPQPQKQAVKIEKIEETPVGLDDIYTELEKVISDYGVEHAGDVSFGLMTRMKSIRNGKDIVSIFIQSDTETGALLEITVTDDNKIRLWSPLRKSEQFVDVKPGMSLVDSTMEITSFIKNFVPRTSY